MTVRVELAAPIFCPRCGNLATVDLVQGGTVEDLQAAHLAAIATDPGARVFEVDDEDDEDDEDNADPGAVLDEDEDEPGEGGGPQGWASCDAPNLFGAPCSWSRWVWSSECVTLPARVTPDDEAPDDEAPDDEAPDDEAPEDDPRPCAWCRAPVVVGRARYCSGRCRAGAYRQRKRAPPETEQGRYDDPREPSPVVAALYVQAGGIYGDRSGVDPWPVERDATRYAGPHPIVAHPPCGPWGAFRHNVTTQRADLAVRAVEQVRRWGGVLEHPAGSRLWLARELPEPGEPPDRWGGWSLALRQADFGHEAPKPTWIYIVGRPVGDHPPLPAPVTQPGGRVLDMDRDGREATPPAFADWLLELAARCRPGEFRARAVTQTGSVTPAP